ncbi:MAG: tetratricopeptide repeat protein [Myxococcota bacterium]|nr:tetratricopeptide repeat protein [Myxococcota bacterium]
MFPRYCSTSSPYDDCGGLRRKPRPARRAGRLCAALAAAILLAGGCAGSIEDRLAEARALQDAGQFSESVEPLREILAREPDLAEANYLLGVALVQTGQPSLAVWPLEKAASEPAHTVPAGLLLASTFLGLNAFGDAVKSADRVIAEDPERVAAIKVRAQALLGANEREKALEDTERLRELMPDDFQSVLMHGTILAELDRLDEAAEVHRELEELAANSGDASLAARGCLARASFFEDNLKDDEKAEAHLRKCLEKSPAEPLALRLATQFFDKRGQREEATAIWERAVEEVPESLQVRVSLAGRYEAAGDAERARATLTEAVELLGSAAAWYQLAEFERRAGNPEQALEALEQAIASSPGRAERLEFARADLLADVGRLDEAEAVIDSLSEPSFRDLMRGRVKLARGDAEGALEAFDEGLRRWPNNAGGRYLAGLAARDVGDYERAKSELREAVRVDPRATDAALVLASLMLAEGRYTRAVEFARNFVTNRGGARPDGYGIYVQAAVAQGQYDAARRTAEALAEGGHAEHAALAHAAIERAADGPDAAAAAIRASEIDPTDPANDRVLRALVDNLSAAEHHDEAIAEVDAAIQANPDVASLHELRGLLLARAGRDDEARPEFERSLALDPDNGRAKAGLAELAARGQDLPRAIALYDEAAADSGGAEAAFAAAQLTLMSGDMAGARQRYEAVVRRDPGHAGARNDLAWLLAESGEDLDRALELAQTAHRLDRSAAVADTLGWVHYKRGEYEQAVARFEEALAVDADAASVRYHLGLALARHGEKQRALDALHQALEVGNFPEEEAARSELARLQRQ